MAGFEVAPADLRAHAGKVDQHAATVGQAVDAANNAMSNDTYGVICQFLPPLFNELEQTARDALRACQQGLASTAESLRATATHYETHDNAVGEKFQGMR
ncbi:type VII secretion target [Lentzea sp. BCCO 10_0856]|uniref:Type VII secretion target n=1 Tax=Lentzea miocenica TaxID=3095431 RepID=A0ABU4TG02_9PSEU|nr:type VII secretion target [Lentzea sp. BCCO 10_0856]MDX8037102.1 type VII secretion target [Lentzea sp. BCCO 10_0856]